MQGAFKAKYRSYKHCYRGYDRSDRPDVLVSGLVERFNGTLKSMLKKMATERPKDWGRCIPSLLCAYREVPQGSLEFSPFEMLCGRTVQGLMQILKELWTKEIKSDEVKTTYQHVLDLKERLQQVCGVAHQNLKEEQKKQK